MGSEHVRFNDGNIEIKRAGFSDYIDDQSFRTSLSLVDGPHRSIDANLYNGIKAWGSLFGYQEKGVDMNSVPSYLKSNYALVQNDNYPDDMYAFEMAKNRSKHLFDPSDSSARSASVSMKRGIYIPQGSVLPLGDNRDNSRDGRYFGPVSQKKINGSVRFLFWPLSRIRYMGNK